MVEQHTAAGWHKTWDRARDVIRLTRLAMRLTWAASPGVSASLILVVMLQALIGPIQLMLAGATVDRAALELGASNRVGPFVDQLPLGAWIALTALTVVLSQLLQPLLNALESIAGDRVSAHISERILDAVDAWHGISRFEDPVLADDLIRTKGQTSSAGMNLLVNGAFVASAILSTVAMAVTLVGLHWLVPLLLVLVSIPQIVTRWEYFAKTMEHVYAQTPEARRLEYVRDLMLTPEPAQDVRLFNLAPLLDARYARDFNRTVASLDGVRRQLVVPVTLMTVLVSATAAGAYVYAVWLAAKGDRTIGELVMYSGALALLRRNLETVGDALAWFPQNLTLLPSLDRILRAPPDLVTTADPQPVSHPFRKGITFDHVHFSYPGQDHPVLQGVSFTIRSGETVALVGHNGAGKTTIVKLLLRLYDPTAGRILLDGVDVRELDLTAYRQELSVIFQDFIHFDLTAGENIAMGDLTALEDESRLLAATRAGDALDLVQSLPDGLSTLLGRRFGGRELSGGEWQKIALARAFIRNCSFLVLDEPTASLDVRSEYDVYERFHQLTQNRAALLISHRFSTVRMADRILVLSEGEITEEGSHEQLLSRNGLYARLYRIQANHYLSEANETEGVQQ